MQADPKGNSHLWGPERTASCTSVAGTAPNAPSRAPLMNVADSTGDFLLSVLNASLDCIKVIELDGSLSYVNANGICTLEIDSFDVVSGMQWCELWPAGSQNMIHESIAAARDGRASRFQAFGPTMKGTEKWWDVSVAPVRDHSGRVERIVSISRDVTEQVRTQRDLQQALNDKDTLAAEIDHRVKNSLSLVASLLRMQGRSSRSPEVQQSLKEASSRISSVMRVHDYLYKHSGGTSVDAGAYLETLCRDVASSVGDSNVRLEIMAEPVELAINRAIPLGIIATELLTNAFKHATPATEPLCIKLQLTSDGVAFRMLVADNGLGLPDNFSLGGGEGLGTKIVSLLVRQIGGNIDASSANGGASFVFNAPLVA